jgi:hypothetical protein
MNKNMAIKGLMALSILASSTVVFAQRLSKISPARPTQSLQPVSAPCPVEAPLASKLVEGFALANTSSGDDLNDRTDLKSKEVSEELSTSKSPEIYIDNNSRNIQVKAWDQPKVKITTTVFFEGDGKLSDEEWFEKLNLSLKTLGSSVRIKSGSINGGSYASSGNTYSWSGGSSGVAVFNGSGQNIGTKSNLKRIVTVYVPAGSKLNIDSKYADVQLTGAFTTATIDITNGNLEAENFNKFFLRSKYSNVTVDHIGIAEIDFMNGRFTAKNIDEADLDTKYSTIELGDSKKIVFRSTNDEYDIESADELRGRKNYGNLRITKLNGSLEMDGTNADIKVRSIGVGLNAIKIDNKYADIRIPLRAIKNYTVDYIGPYSTVYGAFEKQPLKEVPKTIEGKLKEDELTKSLRDINRAVQRFSGEESNETSFTAVVGDGKGLKINMKCQNCTVDFK